jgi:hypothetical protein
VGGDKEMAYYRSLFVVSQERIDFVHPAKYELEQMMLALWKAEEEFISCL